jgi:hypothetical protein
MTTMTTRPRAAGTGDGELLLTMAEAARQLPGRPSPSALWRWTTSGVLVGDARIHLKVYRLGRRLLVRLSDVVDFAERAGAAHTAARRAREVGP